MAAYKKMYNRDIMINRNKNYEITVQYSVVESVNGEPHNDTIGSSLY